ncbi:Protein FAF1 [Beauveria bassiana]|nr:Protein FAF1 [Beauveria bassiana]KAH8715738.1 Protein FAF1 [Beauveria bassiana]
MAVLGKRKSRNEAPSDGVSELDAEAIFRRHFEAQFEPLGDGDEAARAQREQDDDDAVDSDLNGGSDEEEEEEDGDSGEWGGFSSDEEERGDDAEDDDEDDDEDEAPTVQVIDHSKPQVPKEPKMSKKELKAFMSSKVIDHTAPRTTTTDTPSSSSSAKPVKALPEDAPSLIAQDLELRRLLSESHLLTPSHNNAASRSVFSSSVVGGDSSSSSSEPKVFASGRTRQKTTDLRLQALGAKTSVLKQEKMPMNMRKGIVAAARMREERRRREAKENGIILERSGSGSGSSGGNGKKKGSRARQERGVHGPGIGRMRGAELRISEGDVRRIEGSRDTFGRRGRR